MGLVNRPKDISLSRATQSQAKFKSAVGGNLLQSWVNLTIVLTVLDDDAVKGKTRETTKCNLSKALIENCFYGTYAVPPVGGTIISMVATCEATQVVEDGGRWAAVLQQCHLNSAGSLVIARRTE